VENFFLLLLLDNTTRRCDLQREMASLGNDGTLIAEKP
jgi:hypothetical protein